MKQLRKVYILSGLLTVSLGYRVFAQSSDDSAKYYPEASLNQIYTQEQIEQKKADDLERKAIEQRDLYDKKKQDVEKQVAAHRFQIEGLKMQQEKAQADLELLAVDLQHVNGDLASYQSEHQQLQESAKATLDYLQTQRQALADKQVAVEKELQALTAARKKAEQEIYAMSMDIEHFKVDIAKNETKVQESEAQRAALEADEMKVRGEWMQTKMAAAEHLRRRDEAVAQLNDAKKRYDQASKELTDSKMDLAKAEKTRNEVTHKAQADIAKYEHEILEANRHRIAAESERIRLESEMTKMKEYAARIKDSRDQSEEQKASADGLVLKSSLALESARTALTSSVETRDQDSYKSEKLQAQSRGLANAEEAANSIGGGRIWVTKSACKAYSKPSKASPTGRFETGKRLLARDHGSHWVEIMNGTDSVYVESHCGNYEE